MRSIERRLCSATEIQWHSRRRSTPRIPRSSIALSQPAAHRCAFAFTIVPLLDASRIRCSSGTLLVTVSTLAAYRCFGATAPPPLARNKSQFFLDARKRSARHVPPLVLLPPLRLIRCTLSLVPFLLPFVWPLVARGLLAWAWLILLTVDRPLGARGTVVLAVLWWSLPGGGAAAASTAARNFAERTRFAFSGFKTGFGCCFSLSEERYFGVLAKQSHFRNAQTRESR